MTLVGAFSARFGKVWHGARKVNHPDGSEGLALGFCVATVEPHLEGRDEIANQIAAALNLTERLADMNTAVTNAQRLIDDLSRNISEKSIPDYSLLVTVPADLAQMHNWLTLAANTSIEGCEMAEAG